MSEVTLSHRQLVESYLVRHGCRLLHYCEEGVHIFLITLEGRTCQLLIAREWREMPSATCIKERLHLLEVIPFLRRHSKGWVGVKCGVDVLTHVE